MTSFSRTLAALLLSPLLACTAPATDGATAGTAGKPAAAPKTAVDPAKAAAKTPDTPPDADTNTITEARGVDLSRLDAPQKKSFFQLLNSEPSACGKAHSLAVSLRDDATCRDSLSVSQFVADMLANGAAASDIKENLVPLVASLKPRPIDIEGRPIYGNERAPVTVVVFADFECPMCKEEAPGLRQAIDQARGRARLIFKHFPLPMHPRAKPAAIAAAAAHEQGKFWAMHDQIFAHQEALTDADLRTYAAAAGLDLAKFDAAYAARSGQAQVDADRADGEKLEIGGTPAVFVNGREMNRYMFGGTVAGWIDDALRR
jgi:protein-disulfide isomerase